jgi:hypothetical protein
MRQIKIKNFFLLCDNITIAIIWLEISIFSAKGKRGMWRSEIRLPNAHSSDRFEILRNKITAAVEILRPEIQECVLS